MFSRKVSKTLGYYVYLYIDPRYDRPFYIGKGCGNRCFSHVRDRSETDKARLIGKLRRLGLKPGIEILKWGLSEEEALLVESTAIDLLGVDSLTNVVHGHGSRHGARATVEDIATTLDAKPVKVTDPAVLINIAHGYHHDITPIELYDRTRSAWKVGARRDEAKYALSVFEGVVREVYEITKWVLGGTTMKASRPGDRGARRDRRRWEFVGQVAEDRIRKKYVGRSVADYFKPGAQNPIKYAGLK